MGVAEPFSVVASPPRNPAPAPRSIADAVRPNRRRARALAPHPNLSGRPVSHSVRGEIYIRLPKHRAHFASNSSPRAPPPQSSHHHPAPLPPVRGGKYLRYPKHHAHSASNSPPVRLPHSPHTTIQPLSHPVRGGIYLRCPKHHAHSASNSPPLRLLPQSSHYHSAPLPPGSRRNIPSAPEAPCTFRLEQSTPAPPPQASHHHPAPLPPGSRRNIPSVPEAPCTFRLEQPSRARRPVLGLQSAPGRSAGSAPTHRPRGARGSTPGPVRRPPRTRSRTC